MENSIVLASITNWLFYYSVDPLKIQTLNVIETSLQKDKSHIKTQVTLRNGEIVYIEGDVILTKREV